MWKRAVVKKSTIFWDITPCSPLRVNRRFGETWDMFLPEDGSLLCNSSLPPPERRLALNGPHGATSQKMVVFITTAVRTANPAELL
jgi:hypothetical protein